MRLADKVSDRHGQHDRHRRGDRPAVRGRGRARRGARPRPRARRAGREGLGPGRAILPVEDLSDPDAPARIVAAAVQAFGKLDGIVNNAAWIVRSNIDTTDAGPVRPLHGDQRPRPLLLFKAAFAQLKRNQGSVLNIGSINGYCGEANQLAYSISKGALITLSRNLADAHGRDRVRVNHLNVGWVLSPNEYELKVKEGLPRDWPDHPPAGVRAVGPAHVARDDRHGRRLLDRRREPAGVGERAGGGAVPGDRAEPAQSERGRERSDRRTQDAVIQTDDPCACKLRRVTSSACPSSPRSRRPGSTTCA